MSTNVNPETGIRYGTIYLHHLDPDTAQWLWDEGENVSEKEAYEELRLEITDKVVQEIEDGDLDIDPTDIADIELEVERRLDRQADSILVEEPTIEGECEGVKYAISWLGGAPLLWVFESPVIGRFDLCSPCVPNACSIESPNDSGYEGYTVPDDWIHKEK